MTRLARVWLTCAHGHHAVARGSRGGRGRSVRGRVRRTQGGSPVPHRARSLHRRRRPPRHAPCRVRAQPSRASRHHRSRRGRRARAPWRARRVHLRRRRRRGRARRPRRRPARRPAPRPRHGVLRRRPRRARRRRVARRRRGCLRARDRRLRRAARRHRPLGRGRRIRGARPRGARVQRRPQYHLTRRSGARGCVRQCRARGHRDHPAAPLHRGSDGDARRGRELGSGAWRDHRVDLEPGCARRARPLRPVPGAPHQQGARHRARRGRCVRPEDQRGSRGDRTGARVTRARASCQMGRGPVGEPRGRAALPRGGSGGLGRARRRRHDCRHAGGAHRRPGRVFVRWWRREHPAFPSRPVQGREGRRVEHERDHQHVASLARIAGRG